MQGCAIGASIWHSSVIVAEQRRRRRQSGGSSSMLRRAGVIGDRIAQNSIGYCSCFQRHRAALGAMPQLAGFVEGLQLAVLPGKDVQVGHLLIIGLDEDRRPALFNCHTE